MIPRVVIAGTTSGVGKTTIATGLAAALRQRGLKVQTFKCGPDYIDPSYHTLSSGLPCRNLDSWMLDKGLMLETFARAVRNADIALVEGVMGLYDGRTGAEDAGSTAEIARTLCAPVILVVDVAKTARSAAATVLGYQHFDPSVSLAGVILNRIGSPTLLQWVTEAISSATGLPVVGHLPKSADIHLPERHLGLVPTGEDAALAAAVDRIRQQIESTVDVDLVLRIARSSPPLPAVPDSGLFPSIPEPERVVIGVAQDEAFNFYYQDNLDLLAAWGARLIPVSPLRDQTLPKDVDGLYFGGGFPELFAPQLAGNGAFRRSLRAAFERGMPIYGECGGLMYLSESIVDFEGERHEMVGLVPGRSIMQNQRAQMGYVHVEVLEDTLLSRKGMHLRGHVFHWSQLDGAAGHHPYRVLAPSAQLEGFVSGNLLASYVHLHFASEPSLARRFVDTCAQWSANPSGKQPAPTPSPKRRAAPPSPSPSGRGRSPFPSPPGRGHSSSPSPSGRGHFSSPSPSGRGLG